jgi:hypothetical protein
MGAIQIDAVTAARLCEPKTTVELRTEEGKLVGVFTPQREATEEDYAWAMENITKEAIEASLASGPGRPLREILDDLRRQYGP